METLLCDDDEPRDNHPALDHSEEVRPEEDLPPSHLMEEYREMMEEF